MSFWKKLKIPKNEQALVKALKEKDEEIESMKMSLRVLKEDMEVGEKDPQALYVRLLCRYYNNLIFRWQYGETDSREVAMKLLDRVRDLAEHSQQYNQCRNRKGGTEHEEDCPTA